MCDKIVDSLFLEAPYLGKIKSNAKNRFCKQADLLQLISHVLTNPLSRLKFVSSCPAGTNTYS